jgi:hypothetical protein
VNDKLGIFSSFQKERKCDVRRKSKEFYQEFAGSAAGAAFTIGGTHASGRVLGATIPFAWRVTASTDAEGACRCVPKNGERRSGMLVDPDSATLCRAHQTGGGLGGKKTVDLSGSPLALEKEAFET